MIESKLSFNIWLVTLLVLLSSDGELSSGVDVAIGFVDLISADSRSKTS